MDKILNQYSKEEDINLISKKIIESNIIKTTHFHERILIRDIPESLINKTLPKRELIKLIDKRQHKKDIGYDFYYYLSNTKNLKLCFIPSTNKTLLINAILIRRKWQNLIKSIKRRY
ncbi:hypothetical protein CMI38_07055 [Candidatus Pacearchaeota archaeon]|nr:hypothetical protein [Candidatus Pacearchaeota archaeon]|tara:strand:- start:3189 stop:3539 length:351 start_codon:yes stop_codon:yes gene_type:complete